VSLTCSRLEGLLVADPRQLLQPLEVCFELRNLSGMVISRSPPVTHGAVLRQLGAPTTWESNASPADVLAPLERALPNDAASSKTPRA
jgi:hypothetical protein